MSSHISPMFRIDVSAEAAPTTGEVGDPTAMMVAILRELVIGQQRQTRLLEELVQFTSQIHKHRLNELQQWKESNPRLSRACRRAAETLSKVQSQFLENLTEEVSENEDSLLDGEFMLNEFVDRYGPRMAHLNGVLQVLAQLGSGVPSSS